MSQKKYVSLNTLSTFLDNSKQLFATKTDVSNKADSNHVHSNASQTESGFMSVEDKNQLDYGGTSIVYTSGDGAAYTATIDGIMELKMGTKITIVPHTVSTTTTPTLNVNNLGDKYIRMPVAYNTSATSGGAVEEWLVDNKPVTLMYNGTYWITSSLPRTSAQYLYGAVSIENGGTGADNAEDARTNLEVYSKTEVQGAIDELNTKIDNIEVSGGGSIDIEYIQQAADKAYEDSIAYTNAVASNKVDISSLDDYYTKAELDNIELVTVNDIDAICV